MYVSTLIKIRNLKSNLLLTGIDVQPHTCSMMTTDHQKKGQNLHNERTNFIELLDHLVWALRNYVAANISVLAHNCINC